MKTRTVAADYRRQILNDIRRLDNEEVLRLHGIRINDDKSVYDEAYDQTFQNIETWIATNEDDVDPMNEKFGYDDHDFI